MKKSPIKQINIDSLANDAYNKMFAKNMQDKKNSLEVKKFDDTYLKRDESLPVYNTQQHTTNILKGTGMTGEIVKPSFVQKVKNFGANVKSFLDAHRNRFKTQSNIPMPRFGEDPKDPKN